MTVIRVSEMHLVVVRLQEKAKSRFIVYIVLLWLTPMF